MRFKPLMLAAVALAVMFAPAVAGEKEAKPKKVLGVKAAPVTADEAKELDISTGCGLKVSKVKPGSPADKAGIKTGDIIITFNGRKLDSVKALDEAIAKCRYTVKLLVWRNGWEKPMTVKFPRPKKRSVKKEKEPGDKVDKKLIVKELKRSLRNHEREAARMRKLIKKLEEEKTKKEKPEKQPKETPEKETPEKETPEKETPEKETPQKGRPHLGIKVETTFDGTAKVISVEDGSPAEKAGIKVGDVLVKVGETEIKSLDDLRKAITGTGIGGTLEFTVLRGGETETIRVKIGVKPEKE